MFNIASTYKVAVITGCVAGGIGVGIALRVAAGIFGALFDAFLPSAEDLRV